ncbi:MAG TPA: glycoside hydrolase family 2 TIM barrel-domain containing protein [Ignavibacteriaceae bacterium]|nr:glycoside hydrolase family 2 TIM barrel-domain containing protein [Ignavibacteriaceae bacterium]
MILRLLSFIILSSSIISSQEASLIINIEARRIFSLNGNWQIIIDPYETGYYNYRYDPSENGYFKNQKPQSKSDLVEYDFDKSEILQVPGDWNTQKEKLLLYEGTIWYKKDFDYHLKKGNRLFVHFGAVNYKAIVYLNGEKLGEHEGGFTPFNFEITNLVKEKDNFLIVKADNKRSREFVPTLNTDWYNYGGITRDVNLVEVPSTFIQDYFIQLSKGSDKIIDARIRLNGDRKNQKIKIKIPEIRLENSLTADDSGYCRSSFKADLQLWSPDNPKLNEVIIESESDTVKEKIGFRRIEVNGPDILLNGKKIFLKGISAHDEAPLRGGRANSKEDAKIILSWVKELNGNFIRLAHYPHNENVARLADEMGILIWSEIPVYWTILWNNEKTFQNAQNQLTEMITRDKNRASIILWSVANETPRSDERLNFLKKLVEKARLLDSTRLITAALENHYINGNTIMVDDPFGEYLDVIGLNEYLGWYDGLPDKIDRINYQTKYDKPIIISEFGAGALQGLHGDSLTRWTEEYQADVYEHQVNLMKRFPNLSGMTPWILADFRSPRRNLHGIQDHWNRKGLISDRGIRKKAFYILQKFYNYYKQD